MVSGCYCLRRLTNCVEFTFAFTRETNSELLERELHQLVREVRSNEAMEIVPDLDVVVDFVHTKEELVGLYPDTPTTAQDVDQLLQSICTVESILDNQNLARRQSRLAVVTARTMAWTWLTDSLPRLVEEELARQRQGVAGVLQEQRWLPRLMRSVKEILQDRQEDFTFHSHLFAFHSPQASVAFEFHNAMSRRLLAGDELDGAVCRTLTDIVAGWLHYEKDMHMKLAWFVTALREQVGIEVVTMDHVWHMVRNFKSTYIASGTHPHRTTDPRSSLAFKEELSRHPITQDGTKEHEIFRQYQRLYCGEISPLEVTLTPNTGAGWAKYVRMWRTSLAYVESPSSPPQDDYHAKLHLLPDYYLPIRERAPCRIRAKGQGGMYEAGVIKTLPGIFSAVVFRAVTYRSSFFLNHRMVFNSWDDLTTAIDEILQSTDYIGMKRDDEYFGLMRMYGRPNPDRSIELAKTYYESLKERRWPEFCSTSPRPTFAVTLQYFTPKRGEKSIFPQLGNLSRISLVCDLAYASVCDMPTIRDMADCMVTMKSGGLAGLKVLGLLNEFPKGMQQAKKVQVVVDALQEVMDFLEMKFTNREREDMGLDVIVLEHSLCKLSRAEDSL